MLSVGGRSRQERGEAQGTRGGAVLRRVGAEPSLGKVMFEKDLKEAREPNVGLNV